MNPSHVVATGGLTSLLTGALVYLTHWPLAPLTDAQAADFAGLLVFAGGGIWSIAQAKVAKKQSIPPAPAVEPPASAAGA